MFLQQEFEGVVMVKKPKENKQPETKPPYLVVACVNNTGMRNEYSVNALFNAGVNAGRFGILAVGRTYDEHPISLARNSALEELEKMPPEFTHILFVDSDIIPRPEVIVRLLQHNVDVVSGWYLSRGGTGFPVVMKFEDSKEPEVADVWKDNKLFPQFKYYRISEFYALPKDPKTGLIKVDGVGAGCLLIKRSVLPHLLKPYFYEDATKKGSFSDDLWFSYQCKKAKIPIYVDQFCFCAHFTFGTIDLRHVQALLKREQEALNQKPDFQNKPPM